MEHYSDIFKCIKIEQYNPYKDIQRHYFEQDFLAFSRYVSISNEFDHKYTHVSITVAFALYVMTHKYNIFKTLEKVIEIAKSNEFITYIGHPDLSTSDSLALFNYIIAFDKFV